MLAERGVRLVRGRNGPELDGSPHAFDDALLDACRRQRWLFVWALHGSATGHVWHACDTCGEVQLLRPSRNRRCILTYDCPGQMKPLPDLTWTIHKQPKAATVMTWTG